MVAALMVEALTVAVKAALPAGRVAAREAPRQVALGPDLVARARPRAARPAGKQAVDQPEVAGRAAARVEMPAYRLPAVTARVGICRGAAGCGPERAPTTG